MSTVNIIYRDYRRDPGLNRLEQRQGFHMNGRSTSDLMRARASTAITAEAKITTSQTNRANIFLCTFIRIHTPIYAYFAERYGT